MQSASSSTITGATPPTPANDGEATDNSSASRSKRRRMMTSHAVAQLPQTSRLSAAQQQSEQPTTSALQQRVVTDSQTLLAPSFSAAAAAIPEPMEPSTVSDEIAIDDVIAKFVPRHQKEIRECLNDNDREKLLTTVARFLKTLESKGIKLSTGRGQSPTFTLFSLLQYSSVIKDTATILRFFDCANAFFSAVDNKHTKNTSCLSSMLITRKHIKAFADQNENNLRLLATNPHLKQITSMCDRRGVPDPIQAAAMVEWECWKTDGIFNHELFRTFASMRSGRGLFDDEAEITAILAWPCWRVDGEFSMELLRTISSMMSRKGFPDKAKLEAMLAWDCWKIDDIFSMELLRIFSSMMSGCGLPQKEQVEAILAWPCWQVYGNFSPELFRTFASMMSGKGLFDYEEEITAMLAWPCWQVDGEFSMELLRTVSSMMSRKGFPDEAKLKALLAWDCWKVDGKFSFDLLRIFSSMSSSRGLLKDEAKINEILAWECWKIDGEFSIELLRTVASMLGGRGLPEKEPTENLLSWPCWQVDGKFSFELLRTFSSMSHGRGLIKQAEVERVLAWPCWQVNGKFSLDLLRIFSSMMNSQGLFDDEAPIKTILAWDCWKVDGKFSLPLLQYITPMMHGRGLLKKAPVEQILSWPCWQVNGKFTPKLLQIFSLMMIGKGMLKTTALEAFMAWLPSDHITRDKEQTCLKVACQLFTQTGLPDPKILADIEATLRRYIPDEAMVSDEEESGESQNESQVMVQIKALTLFCAAPAKWRTSIAEIEQFLIAHNTAHLSQKAFRATLDSLLQILANHGQEGFRFWLKYYSDNPDRKHALTRALFISAPLAHTKFALTQLPESEWPEYIELCKNLTPAPNKDQWQALKPLRDLLHRRFTLTLRKRMMLEILWPQSEHNRLRYAEKLDTLLNTVPTIDQLYRLHQAFKPQKLQAFLDACLARENTVGQSINETVPEIKTQELLLEGLLLTNHYLSDHGQIPELCFSKQIAGADGTGVFVGGDAEMSGHQRLWHFIAAMLIELKQTEYQFKQQQLWISPPDSEPIVLPKPEFTAANTGFMITNWSLEQLTAFFRATEFTEHWYKNPDDTRDICVIRREERLLQMRARPQNITQTGYKAGHKSSRSLLSPSVIINIIKQGLRLKPAVWSSLEHYAKNGQLSDTLCRLLAPIIEKELASTVPDAIPEIVKKTVAQRLRQTGTSQTAAVATATQSPSSSGALATTAYASPIISPSQMLPASLDIALDMALDTMARDVAIEELEHFPVLGRAELDMLEPWRDQMTYSQLMDVIAKINLQSVELETVVIWQQTFERRRRDHLGLDLDEFLDSLLEGAVEL